MVITREGEGMPMVHTIHVAANEAVNIKVLPVRRQHLPEVASMMTLHRYDQTPSGAGSS
jgi:hypothetical protein